MAGKSVAHGRMRSEATRRWMQTFNLPKFDSNVDGYCHITSVSGIMFLLSVGNFVPEPHTTILYPAWATQTGRDGRSHHSNGDDDIKLFRNIVYKGKAQKVVEPILNRQA